MAIGSIIGATAVGLAGTVASTAIGATAQSSLNKQTMDFNREEAEKSREFNSEEAEKSREFNSEEAEKARLFQSTEAEKARDYYSESSVMQRRSDAGLNSAVLNAGAPPTSTGVPSGATASGSSASSSPASVSPTSIPQSSNPVIQGIEILQMSQQLRSMARSNLIGDKYDDSRAAAEIGKTSAEIDSIGQDIISKQLDNDFTFSTFKDRLDLMSNSVTSSRLDNLLKELQKFDLDNKIQNGIQEAYFLWVENNSKMFNTLLNAENFEHQWELDKNELRLRVEEYKMNWNNMSYSHGFHESSNKSTSSNTSSSRVNGSSSSIGLSHAGFRPSSRGNGSLGGVLEMLRPSSGSSSSITDSSSFDTSQTDSNSQSFCNSKLGEFSININALWDIVNDSSQDVKSRKAALSELRKTLGDLESYGRFQERIRALRGAAFVNSNTIKVE